LGNLKDFKQHSVILVGMNWDLSDSDPAKQWFNFNQDCNVTAGHFGESSSPPWYPDRHASQKPFSFEAEPAQISVFLFRVRDADGFTMLGHWQRDKRSRRSLDADL
jgi:hypothetical protein